MGGTPKIQTQRNLLKFSLKYKCSAIMLQPELEYKNIFLQCLPKISDIFDDRNLYVCGNLMTETNAAAQQLYLQESLHLKLWTKSISYSQSSDLKCSVRSSIRIILVGKKKKSRDLIFILSDVNKACVEIQGTV